jgi:hypothetical protein
MTGAIVARNASKAAPETRKHVSALRLASVYYFCPASGGALASTEKT